MQAKVLACFYVSFRISVFFFSCNIYFYMPTAMPIDKNCPKEEGGAEGAGGGVGKWRADDENDSGNLWSSHKTHNQ